MNDKINELEKIIKAFIVQLRGFMTSVYPIIPATGKTIWTLGIIALLMILVFIFTLGIFLKTLYISQYAQFEISPTGLQVKGDLTGKFFAKDKLQVDRAMIVNLRENTDLQPILRMAGTAVSGYKSGWYKLRDKEKALLYVTDDRNVVYLPTTQGYSLLLSVKNPQDFIHDLQNN